MVRTAALLYALALAAQFAAGYGETGAHRAPRASA
jgi:hypothetical protein